MGFKETGRKQMTGHRITLLGSHDRELQEWLSGHPEGHERGAIVLFRCLARRVEGQPISDRFLSADIVKMTGDWIIESSDTHIRINMRKFPEIYLRCETDGLVLGFAHNHPMSDYPSFSPVDDANELNILKGLSGCQLFPCSAVVSRYAKAGRFNRQETRDRFDALGIQALHYGRLPGRGRDRTGETGPENDQPACAPHMYSVFHRGPM